MKLSEYVPMQPQVTVIMPPVAMDAITAESEITQKLLNPPKPQDHKEFEDGKIYTPGKQKRCPWKVAGALSLMFGTAACVAGYYIYKALSQRAIDTVGDLPVNRTGNWTTSIFDESSGSGSGMGLFDNFSNNTNTNATAIGIISEWD